MVQKKFADTPKLSYFLIQISVMLPVPFVFCYMGDHGLPNTFMQGLGDIGASLLTLLLFIPVMLLFMVGLKLLFYGSLMGTKRRVSLKTKNIITALFIILAVPPASLIQAEAFLWVTGRAMANNFYEMTINGMLLFAAGLPGFLISLNDLKNKVARIKNKVAMIKNKEATVN